MPEEREDERNLFSNNGVINVFKQLIPGLDIIKISKILTFFSMIFYTMHFQWHNFVPKRVN